ncbi:hypothetical protein KO488_06920 [Poseidonibacter lekithochrous]|uniref:hypothetical protein n=1 Tax=Poseidonibacter TaxID=2321187 RepID=UPI001C07F49F|nr:MULTISPECIES: hypothetical protein [Poseidonibacter]MBU3014486.1 hypothetical protein [Poseidonibacter lekithochrous]MDO6827784.1 hypothetical protein [Poseidonibacter sp. 1_MG-2023]
MKSINNLYKILNKDNFNCSIKLSSKDHPVFKAHFPDNEILPGFLQIDIIAQIFNHRIISIKKAKFISLILPQDVIDYNIKALDDNKFKIIIKKHEKKISEIIYETE